MIKAVGYIAGKRTLIIGLSAMNCQKLLDNKPIHFSGKKLGLPDLDVVVLGGDTEDSIIEDMRSAGLVPRDSAGAELERNSGNT